MAVIDDSSRWRARLGTYLVRSWEVGRRDGVGVLVDTSRSVARADHLRVRPRAAARAARLSLCRRPGAAAATEP